MPEASSGDGYVEVYCTQGNFTVNGEEALWLGIGLFGVSIPQSKSSLDGSPMVTLATFSWISVTPAINTRDFFPPND